MSGCDGTTSVCQTHRFPTPCCPRSRFSRATPTTGALAWEPLGISPVTGTPCCGEATGCSTAALSIPRSRMPLRTSGHRPVKFSCLFLISRGAHRPIRKSWRWLLNACQTPRRGIRRRHAESVCLRVRCRPRTSACHEHDGVGVVRRKRWSQSSALHRHQSLSSHVDCYLSCNWRPVRRSIADHACLHWCETGSQLQPDYDHL